MISRGAANRTHLPDGFEGGDTQMGEMCVRVWAQQKKIRSAIRWSSAAALDCRRIELAHTRGLRALCGS